MSKRTLLDVWQRNEAHAVPSPRSFRLRVPFTIRMVLISVGAVPLIGAVSMLTGVPLLDDSPYYLVGLIMFWIAGSTWVLAGLAQREGGFGNLEVVQILLIPILLLVMIFGGTFFLMMVGLSQMH